jgi:hypothetical protein
LKIGIGHFIIGHNTERIKNARADPKIETSFFEAQLLADFGQVHQLNAKDLNAIQSIINQADSLLNILEKTPKEALNSEWTKDIYFWQFFIQHLKLHIKTYSQLLQLSEDYKTARDLKNKKKKLYKHQLNQILHTTKDLLKDWQDLKITYQALWLKENRYHWMKEATAVFENKIQDLASLSTLLQYVNQLPNAAPLPPAATIKLDITANQKDYFTFWLLSPPHPLQKGQSMQDDFLDDLGGEHQARPTPYDWKKFQSPYSYKVPLDKIAPIQKNSIIHAYCRIESPKEQSIKFVLNAPASSLILNGEQLNRQDNESTMLLKKGKNHLILKMYYSGQKKAFSFHLPDVKVVNRKQKYTIVEMKK